MIDIRPVVDTDLPHILKMVHALAVHHGDPVVVTLGDLKRDFFGSHPWVHGLIAVGQGYAALCPLAQVQYGVRGMDVHHLYVEPEARGHGVGRALMDAAQRYAQGLGCRYLTVGTHPDNDAAQAMYRAIGYEGLGPAGPRFRVKW